MLGSLVAMAIALSSLQAASPSAAVSSSPENQPSLELGSVASVARALRPGDFLWAPQVAPAGPMLMIVNRQTQRAVLYRNGVAIAVTTVSTGRKGHRTPTGVFAVLQKNRVHFSSLYDDAPMPFIQRLTWDGVALHAGQLPGYPASHGCIRLPSRFAALLFEATRLGMIVVVTDQILLPAIAPVSSPLPIAQAPTPDPLATSAFWRPDVAPAGPVSVVISSTDHQLVVLRNARVIGRMPVIVGGDIPRAFLYRLAAINTEGRRWERVALPGQVLTGTELLSQQFQLGEEDRIRIESVLALGATIIVTPDTLATAPANYGDLVPKD